MTRTGRHWGALLFALALVASSMGSALVPAARAAAADPPAGCVPTAASTVPSPTATWTLGPTGPKVYWHSATFAPTVCRLIVFGGTDMTKGLSRDTWLFDPAAGSWTRIAGTRTGPAARAFGEFAWDPVRRRAVLFGGRAGGALQDTWSFDPSTRTWTPLITSCRRTVCPPSRWGGALVWSSAIQKLVLFGGTQDGTFATLGDVWTFDTAWHLVKTTGAAGLPSGRFLFGMAEDAATGTILVYGGVTSGLIGTRETWQLDPLTWTWRPVPTAASPTAEAEVGMAWLPSLGAIVLTGGSANHGTGLPDTTWAFDPSVPTWVQVGTDEPVPSMHLNATLTTDPCHGLAIYLGAPDQEFPPTHGDYTWILR